MSSALALILKCGHLRRIVGDFNAIAIRSISSTGRLKDASRPSKLNAKVETPKNEAAESDPYEPLKTQESPRLFRPIVFTLAVGICTFTGASYLTRSEHQALVKASTVAGASVGDLQHERIQRKLKYTNAIYAWLQEIDSPGPIVRSYTWLGNWWLNASDGERVALGLVAVNTVVFLAWQIPPSTVGFFLAKHFTHHPLSGRSYTLLTSVFSHMNFLHFGVNMVALQSFVRESAFYIGSAESLDPTFRGAAPPNLFTPMDPNYTAHVLAFFITAGVFSTLGSHASQAFRLMRTKRLTVDVKAVAQARNAIRPGLGASGAIYGTLFVTALAIPDAEVQLFFLPFLTLPIRWGATGLIALDTTGILRGWWNFDHYCHLSGAAFGAAYFFGGPYLWAKAGTPWPPDHVSPRA